MLKHAVHIVVCLISTLGLSSAQADSVKVEWSGKDASGAAIRLPAEKPVLLLFVMPEQAQSAQAMKQAVGVAKDAAVDRIVIFSGDAKPPAVAAAPAWRTILDSDYSLSGKLSVRVWPTTVLLDETGQVIAHLAGLPKNYDKDMDSYLAFATKRIDKAALDQRLHNHDVVADSPEQIADRHFQVAQRLMDKGLVEQARVELTNGLKLHPNSPQLQLTLVRAMLTMGDADGAMKAMEKIDPSSIPASQLNLMRGEALIQLGKWEEARRALGEAVKLNPQPAEAWYQLGVVHEHSGDLAHAAEAYRKAFESTRTGRRTPPATQP
jgi:tetratricopeptide (TPR) repeat protein